MRGKFFAALTLAATLLITGCGGGDAPAKTDGGDKAATKEVTLKIGATPVPHSEILEEIKPDLKEKGITLEIVEFNDYVSRISRLTTKNLTQTFSSMNLT